MIKSNIIKITEPDGTKTRISRCTDQQALPVKLSSIMNYLNFSLLDNKNKSPDRRTK